MRIPPWVNFVLRFRGEDLYLVTTIQLMTQGHELMVHLRADAVAAEEGVDGEGKIEGGSSRRHRLDFSLWGEDEDLRGEEVQLDGVEEVHGVGLWVVEDLLDGAQPVVELVLVLRVFLFNTVLVFPVGSETLLRDLVHTVRTDLYLYPSALLRHQRHVECLIAVGLGVGEPVAQTIGVRLVDLRDGHVDVEALVDLLFPDSRGEDDAHGEDVVDLLEGDVLVLHLVPDGVGGLHTFLDLILDTHLLQGVLDGVGELGKQFVARNLCRKQLPFDGCKVIGMLELETEVLKFRLYLVQSQAVSQWCIDVERLTSDLILLVGRLRVEGAHVLQTVADLNEDHADIVAHRQQQLLEVLCLCRGLLTEDTTQIFVRPSTICAIFAPKMF